MDSAPMLALRCTVQCRTKPRGLKIDVLFSGDKDVLFAQRPPAVSLAGPREIGTAA